MSTNNVTTSCPHCGSQKTSIKVKLDSIEIPFANQAIVETKLLKCKECGMETDITESDDLKEKINIEVSKSIENLIDALAVNNNWTYSSIEHALDLPERTLSRWKNKPNLSKGNITLLRILNTFPWIVEVADNNYRTSFANQKVVQAGAVILEVERKNERSI